MEQLTAIVMELGYKLSTIVRDREDLVIGRRENFLKINEK